MALAHYQLDDLSAIANLLAESHGLESFDLGDGVTLNATEAMASNQLLPLFLLGTRQLFEDAGLSSPETQFPFELTFDAEANVAGLVVNEASTDAAESACPSSLVLACLSTTLGQVADSARKRNNLPESAPLEGVSLEPLLSMIEDSENAKPQLQSLVPTFHAS